MKLTYFQLDAHLTRELAPIYLVSGEEWLLKQEALKSIRHIAKNAGFSEHLRLVQENDDHETLFSLLQSQSLLAEKRIIEVCLRDELPGKNLSNLLLEYAQNIAVNNLLLLEIGKLDARTMKSIWYASMEKQGVVVQIWPITVDRLPQWIKQRAKKYKLELSDEAIAFIVDYSEGNLTAAAQLIEKIYLHKPQAMITAEHIKTFFNDESRFSVFDLGDSLIAKDKERLLKILQHLNQERIEPVLVLWNLVRELRLIVSMSFDLKNGTAFSQIITKYRIFPKRQAHIKKFLQTTDETTCMSLLQRATEIDKYIKGAATGDVWKMLQLFVLTI